MNKNPINRFFFASGCEQPSKNYPGLIDAIYIVFFNDRTREYEVNDLLLAMNGVESASFKMVSDVHAKFDEWEVDEALPDVKVMDVECANLTFEANKDWGVNTRMLRVPINVDKSSFSSKSQGELRGITYSSELNAVLEERSSQVSELIHALHTTGFKIGVFFRDANGDTRLLADPHYPMKIESSDESGEGPTGTSAASIKFTQVSKIPPIYYRGIFQFGFDYGAMDSGNMRMNCGIGVSTLDEPAVLTND